eukprot:COSAG06_NODE_3187_length_5716_cov_3.110913_2_plen_232_part_00
MADADTTAAEQLMVEKFRQKFSTIRDAFQTLDVRGDAKIAAVELQAGLASKFDIAMSDEVAAAIVARYNSAGPGEPPAFDFATFAAMYDGTFTQYYASSIGAKADPSDPGMSRAHNWRPSVDPTAEQAALTTVRRIGAKLRQHASSSARSRHFTELFVKMDVDRTGTLTADEVSLGMYQLGLDLCARPPARPPTTHIPSRLVAALSRWLSLWLAVMWRAGSRARSRNSSMP